MLRRHLLAGMRDSFGCCRIDHVGIADILGFLAGDDEFRIDLLRHDSGGPETGRAQRNGDKKKTGFAAHETLPGLDDFARSTVSERELREFFSDFRKRRK
jgi:hypothetical protein